MKTKEATSSGWKSNEPSYWFTSRDGITVYIGHEIPSTEKAIEISDRLFEAAGYKAVPLTPEELAKLEAREAALTVGI